MVSAKCERLKISKDRYAIVSSSRLNMFCTRREYIVQICGNSCTAEVLADH